MPEHYKNTSGDAVLYTWINKNEFIYLVQKAYKEQDLSACFACRHPNLTMYARLYKSDCKECESEYLFSMWLIAKNGKTLIFQVETIYDANDIIEAFRAFSESCMDGYSASFYIVRDNIG